MGTVRSRLFIYFVLALLLLAAREVQAAVKPRVFLGKVVKVVDGDTIYVEKRLVSVSVRMDAIDAPESKQARGKEATAWLSAKLLGKKVRVVPKTIDRYGRIVAQVELNGKNVNRAAVEAGWAWVYREYISKKQLVAWVKLEDEAKLKKLGVWQDSNPERPSDYRKRLKK